MYRTICPFNFYLNLLYKQNVKATQSLHICYFVKLKVYFVSKSCLLCIVQCFTYNKNYKSITILYNILTSCMTTNDTFVHTN